MNKKQQTEYKKALSKLAKTMARKKKLKEAKKGDRCPHCNEFVYSGGYHYCPSPEDIKEATKKIKELWTEEQTENKFVGPKKGGDCIPRIQIKPDNIPRGGLHEN